MSKPKEFLVIEKSILDAITRRHTAMQHKLHTESSSLEFWMGKGFEAGAKYWQDVVTDEPMLFNPITKEEFLNKEIDL